MGKSGENTWENDGKREEKKNPAERTQKSSENPT
jgi:hypothetical protein